MAVKTKKTFPNAVGANGQSSTVFTPVEVQLNNQDDLDVYVTLSGGTRVLQLRQSAGSTAQSSHPQVNDTTGLYFPAVSAGTTLYNYTLSTDNNTITFSTALPSGAVVSIERRTRDADSSYTNFASGSTIRATDLNNSSTESNFTAQEARNKAFELEGKIFGGEATGTSFISSDEIVDGTIVNADINNNAEIAVSKLANGSARQILQTAANGTDVEFTSNVDIPGTLDVTGNADIDSNLNVDGTLTVASAVDFNNDLDVDGNTNLDNTTIDGYINVTGVATVDNVRIDGNEVRAHSGNLELDSQGGTVTVDDNLTVTGNLTFNGTFNNLSTTETAILDGATVTTAELNTLDGITSTTAELNILDGVTATAAEINKLDGATVTTAELNTLDGITATTSELNILDGVTATATEINKLDGVTSTTAELNILDGVTATTAEINTLDGVTATAAELNLNDGQTATPTEVNILDGATLTTTELNKLDGYTGTAADLNEVVAGKSVVETISSTATDAQIPTAQAVNERITTVVSDVGGFVPIANETSFPTANPDLDNAAGTIVSIKALSSSFSTGSGVTTHTFTNGAGSGNNVTITGLTQNTTYPAGRGMLLETTTTSGNGSATPPRAYAFHRLTLDETGVANAQAAIDDWDERYYGPLGSEPNTRPGGGARVQGDLYFSTVDNQMKVWNNAASQWDDVASSASSNIVTLSPAFNGSETEFTCSTVPVDAQSLLLSINGVIQKPNSGTSAPSEGFVKLANGKIKLGSAPASGATYFAVSLGNTVSVGTPSPDTVGATELKNGEIANVHVSSSAAIAKSKLASLDIVNADVNASAAIAKSKLASLDIVNADVNASAAIAKSKLASLDIVNADVNANAAIAGSKISPNFGSQNIVTTGNGGIGTTSVPTGFKLAVNGDLSLGETSGSDNTFIDQKQNGQLELINSGRDDNSGAIRINRMNSIGGDTTYFRDVNIYDGKGNSVMYVDGSAASVGIGTTSPTAELGIFHATDPEINLNVNTHGAVGKILGDADGLTLSGNGSTNQIRFKTADNHVMRIDSSGRVMIGVTSTGHASGNADDLCVGNNDSSSEHGITIGSNVAGGIRWADSASGSAGVIEYVHSDNRMTFSTNTLERMRLDSSGRLLIGTTSVNGEATLNVKGLTTAWGGAGNSTATVGAKLVLEDDQGRRVGMWAPKAADGAVGSITNHHFYVVTGNASHSLFNHTTKDLEIIDGNLKVASGHGIDFSATSNASQGSASNHNELLDDYEEGTWSPGIDKNASSMSVSYNASTTSGTYTKIGRMVTVWFDINVTGGGTSGGGAPYITELPFAVLYGQATQGGYGAPQFRDMTLTHSNMRIYGNSSYLANSQIYLQQFNSSGNTEQSSFNASGRITGQATYFTT